MKLAVQDDFLSFPTVRTLLYNRAQVISIVLVDNTYVFEVAQSQLLIFEYIDGPELSESYYSIVELRTSFAVRRIAASGGELFMNT